MPATRRNDLPPACYAAIRRIDAFTDATGRLVSLLMLFLVATISYECFSRYLLGVSTNWVPETSVMANSAAYMLGCGYALLKGAHVRTDLLWERYSERTRGALDLASYLLLFLPAMLALIWISVGDVWYSFRLREMSAYTPAGLALWPFRAALPLALLLLVLQGVSETLKSWHSLKTGREFARRERIEA